MNRFQQRETWAAIIPCVAALVVYLRDQITAAEFLAAVTVACSALSISRG